MSFIVQLSPTAEADLERLFDFLLERAETTEDLDHAGSVGQLSTSTSFKLNPWSPINTMPESARL
jgi:hypothetical protein